MLHWIDLAFQLGVVALGYLLGAAAAFLPLRLAGAGLPLDRAALGLLALPLAATLLAEATTGLWRHTPGTLGLGGLTVFLPMLFAGAGAVVLAWAAQRLPAALDATLPRGEGLLTAWVAVAVLSSVLALGLWRFWPAPTARLW